MAWIVALGNAIVSDVLVGWTAQYLYNRLAQKPDGWRGTYRIVRLLMFASLHIHISKIVLPILQMRRPRQSMDLLAVRSCHVDPFP